MTLVVYLLLPLACVAAAPGLGSNTGLPARLVVGVALYEGILLALGFGSGYLGLLGTPAYTVASCAALVILVAVGVERRNASAATLAFAFRRWRADVGPTLSAAAIALCWIIGLQIALDATIGTYHTDGLNYHIPRAMFWVWHGGFRAWPTPEWQQIGLPIAADVILGSKILLRDGWYGLAYVTLWLTLGAAACVYVASRSIGVTRRWAVVATVLFLSFPSVGQRVVAGNSDIAASFPAMASAVVLLVVSDIGSATACALLLNSIAVACKPTVLVPLLVVDGLAIIWRRRSLSNDAGSQHGVNPVPLAFGAVGGVALLVASYLPSYDAFGDVLGGDIGRAHSTLAGGVPAALTAAASSIVHWVLEPLGYLPRGFRQVLFRDLHLPAVYTLLGAGNPAGMLPNASPENTGTGVLSIALFILAVGSASRAVRGFAVAAGAGFLLSAAIVAIQPWSSRFFLVNYALFALLGVIALAESGPNARRWCDAALLAALAMAVTGTTRWSLRQLNDHAETKNLYAILPDSARARIALGLGAKRLLVLADVETPLAPAEGSVALLSGPNATLRIEYLTCTVRQDWGACLREAASRSPELAVVYGENEQLEFGPFWPDRDRWRSGIIDRVSLSEKLVAAGWRRAPLKAGVEIWSAPAQQTDTIR